MRRRYRAGLLVLAAAPVLTALALSLFLTRMARGAPAELDVPAPELKGGSWINTGGGRPLSLASRRGKVTVLHFWTFG
jgi:hypothetical protein